MPADAEGDCAKHLGCNDERPKLAGYTRRSHVARHHGVGADLADAADEEQEREQYAAAELGCVCKGLPALLAAFTDQSGGLVAKGGGSHFNLLIPGRPVRSNLGPRSPSVKPIYLDTLDRSGRYIC